MARYHSIVTDAGTEFEVGLKSIEEIKDEFVQGRLSGFIEIHKKAAVHARVHVDKVDTFYYTK